MRDLTDRKGTVDLSSFEFHLAYNKFKKLGRNVVMLYVDDLITAHKVSEEFLSSAAIDYDLYLSKRIEHNFKKQWHDLKLNSPRVETVSARGKLGPALIDFIQSQRPEILFIGSKRKDLIKIFLLEKLVAKFLKLPTMKLVVVTDCRTEYSRNFIFSYEYSKINRKFLEWIKTLGKSIFIDMRTLHVKSWESSGFSFIL